MGETTRRHHCLTRKLGQRLLTVGRQRPNPRLRLPLLSGQPIVYPYPVMAYIASDARDEFAAPAPGVAVSRPQPWFVAPSVTVCLYYYGCRRVTERHRGLAACNCWGDRAQLCSPPRWRKLCACLCRVGFVGGGLRVSLLASSVGRVYHCRGSYRVMTRTWL